MESTASPESSDTPKYANFTFTILHADGKTQSLKIEKSDYEDTLSLFQRIVGGSIEHVYLDGRAYMYVNENGKFENLPLNKNATLLFQNARQSTADVIVGNALLITHDGSGELI